MGFELNLFLSDVDEAIVCWICKNVFDKPLATPCGHVFCSVCAITATLEFGRCPRMCRGHFTVRELNHVQALSALIGKLEARCPNWTAGCDFVGQFRKLNAHLEECNLKPKSLRVSASATAPGITTSENAASPNAMQGLELRAAHLQEEVAALRQQLRFQAMRIPESSYKTDNEDTPEDQLTCCPHEKGIPDVEQVNGQDLSGASHQAAAEAFKSAAEPITVVLCRNRDRARGNDKPVLSPRRDNADTTLSQNLTALEQAVLGDGMCFCRFLIDNCSKMPTPMSTIIVNELLRYKNAISGDDQRDEDRGVGDVHDRDDVSSFQEDGDDVFGVYYEEVVLKRPSCQDKLGMTLCDEEDRVDGRTKVVVNQVTPNSIAARCRNIYEGDHIVKVNGIPVNNMTEASRLLSKDTPVVTFLIARYHLEEAWQVESLGRSECDEGVDIERSGNVLRDVTNYAEDDEVLSATSDESRLRFLEHGTQGDACVEYAAIVSQKLAIGTTDSGLSHCTTITSSSCATEKDSGIGQATDSVGQSTTRKSSDDARLFGTASSAASSAAHSAAREFTYVAAQKYCNKKHVSASKDSNDDSGDSAKGSMERPLPAPRSIGLQRLNEEIENLNLDSETPSTNCDEFCDDEFDDVSPWVKIARQDYQEKIRQFETIADVRMLHPALSADAVELSAARTNSVGTDNTSSAYSTGDSFRSSSTTSAPRLSNESHSPPLSPERSGHVNESCYLRAPAMWTDKPLGATMSYYVSSDANSDGEGPACYLTHDDGSGSEGFADAGLEFSPLFTSMNDNTKLSPPLPISAPEPRYFGASRNSVSPTPSTRQLCKAAAHVAQSRRHSSNNESADSKERLSSFVRQRSCSRSTTCETSSSKDRSESETVVAANCPKPSAPVDDIHRHSASPRNTNSRHKLRRSSDHAIKNGFVRPPFPNRSLSYTEGQQATNSASDIMASCIGSADDVSMEWKVRVRNDGTRYITKRPVRERLLREREKKLMAERCGVTTDDDAATEMKLGRHWSRDERKRHVRIAREKKKRRDFMMRCRLEALNENAPADGEIVELSHKKMARRKHKRMLLDNFVTVQEILAHGDRSSGVAKLNPLLSVTYI